MTEFGLYPWFASCWIRDQAQQWQRALSKSWNIAWTLLVLHLRRRAPPDDVQGGQDTSFEPRVHLHQFRILPAVLLYSLNVSLPHKNDHRLQMWRKNEKLTSQETPSVPFDRSWMPRYSENSDHPAYTKNCSVTTRIWRYCISFKPRFEIVKF